MRAVAARIGKSKRSNMKTTKEGMARLMGEIPETR